MILSLADFAASAMSLAGINGRVELRPAQGPAPARKSSSGTPKDEILASLLFKRVVGRAGSPSHPD
jgi:hypothetical protein